MNDLKYFSTNLYGIFYQARSPLDLTVPLYPIFDYLLDGLLGNSIQFQMNCDPEIENNQQQKSSLSQRDQLFFGKNFDSQFFLSTFHRLDSEKFLQHCHTILQNIKIPHRPKAELIFILEDEISNKKINLLKSKYPQYSTTIIPFKNFSTL